jgi:excisionase family DNA binding protein
MMKDSNLNQTQNDFVSIKEFAGMVGVHPNTIRRAVKSGRICAFQVGSGKKSTYRIARSEVNRMALFDMEEMIERMLEKRTQNNPKML